MCTIGYGDTVPTNPAEQILCIFTMISVSLIYGYSLNTIGQIIQDLSKVESEISIFFHLFLNL